MSGLLASMGVLSYHMLQAAAACLLLLAALPYLLSTAAGTRAVAAAASRVLPGQVRISSMQLGWHQPLRICGLEVLEHQGGGRRLLAVDRISSAEPPLSCLGRHSPVTLVLRGVQADGSLDDACELPRLVTHLQAARLLRLLMPWLPAAGPTAPDTAAAQEEAGASMAPAAAADDTTGACVADAFPTRAPAAATAAGAAKGGGGGDGALTQAGRSDRQQLGVAAGRSGIPEGGAGLRARLAVADSCSGLSAELRSPWLQVVVADARLLLPTEVAAALGPHAHVVAALGNAPVRQLGDEVGDGLGWLHEPLGTEGGAGSEGPGVGSANEGWAPQAPPAGPPVVVQVNSEHVMVDVKGWATGLWQLQLAHPVSGRMHVTPELARLTLAQLNPLLHDVVQLADAERVEISFSPAGAQLPCSSGVVRVAPMRLSLGHSPLVSQLLQLLRQPRTLVPPLVQWRAWLQGEATAAPAGALAAPALLSAWTGPMEVVMDGPGRYSLRRVDMQLGLPAGRTLQVAVWGQVDVATDAMHLHLGLPAGALALAGVTGLPEGYMLPLEVTGTLAAPCMDFKAAARKLAVLSALQLSRGSQGGAGTGRAGVRAGGEGRGATGAGGAALLARLHGSPLALLTRAASAVLEQVDQTVAAQVQGQAVPRAVVDVLPWEAAGGEVGMSATASSPSGPYADGDAAGAAAVSSVCRDQC